MIKTLTSKPVYKIVNGEHIYLVTLSKLKNTFEGRPRFEAEVINIFNNHIPDYTCSSIFRFRGHYYNELQEAEWLINNMYK